MSQLVFWGFSIIVTALFLGRIFSRPDYQKSKKTLPPIQTSIGENYPVFLIKMMLYLMLVFILNYHTLWKFPVILCVPLLIILLAIFQISGYRYK